MAGLVGPVHPSEGTNLSDPPDDRERLADTDGGLVPDDSPGPVQPGDWWVPFLDWLASGRLPPDQTEAQRLVRKAKSYSIVDEELN